MNPRVSTRFSQGSENGRADAGQGGRTCLARPESLARTGTNFIFRVPADHEKDWQLYRLMPILLYVMTMLTYMTNVYSTRVATKCALL